MMRRIFQFALVTAALAVMASVAAAGMNPNGMFGLPNVDFQATSVRGTSGTTAPSGTADNNYYSAITVTGGIPGNRGSAMCVACHTRNPSPYTYYIRQGTNPTGSADGDLYGSHWVTANFDQTSEGGGYTNAKGGVRTTSPIYMADNASVASYTLGTWTQWPYAPEYGDGATGSGGINHNSGSPGSVAAEMICESCHNITINAGNPYKLLAWGIADKNTHPAGPYATTDALCRGCHGDMESGLNNEWQLHPLLSGSWTATQHHRNAPASGAPVGKAAATGYFGSGTSAAGHLMGTINSAYYTPAVQMWAAGIGTRVDGVLSWSNATTGRVCDADVGAQSQIASGRNAGVLQCTSCHRAHNADSSAGATILMRSNTDCNPSTTLDMSTFAIGASSGFAVSLGLGTDNAWRGVTRMQDRGGRSAAFNSTNPNCLSCHQ